MKKFPLSGNIVILGFGSIGKGILPLVLRHVDVPKSRIFVLEADAKTRALADKYDVTFINTTLTPENHQKVVGDLLPKGSFVVNCTNDVSSIDLVKLCNKKESLYIDSCIEPWVGHYTNLNQPLAERSNYVLRHKMRELNKELRGGPTAMVAFGANPGMVSFLVKEALLRIAKDTGVKTDTPRNQPEWAALSQELGIHGIHIAERDHQVRRGHKRNGVFYNTWSIDGLINEGMQPCELGWGTKETWFPPHGHQHTIGSKCAIYLDTPGMLSRVRSWTPLEGNYLGYLITHNEAISLADYLTVKHNDKPVYRPTAFYAYHPSNDAILSLHEFIGRNFEPPTEKVLLNEEITDGIDELGVLLYGHKKNAYWYGSQLSIHDARKRITDQNATSLQVTSTIMGAMKWAIENPRRGIVEAEEVDHEAVLKFVEPYVSPLVGQYTDWTPAKDDNPLLIPDLDKENPWSFKNILLRN